MSPLPTNSNLMTINGDSPINNLREDRFSRTSLVEHVAKAIQKKCESEHDSLCIGIYGRWGEGKTSFVNMLKSLLLADRTTDNVYIANFNPWIINDEQGLIKEFFKTIASNTDDKLKGFIAKYGGIITYSSQLVGNLIVPGFGTALKTHLKELEGYILKATATSLEDQKKRISNKLIESNEHLLVFIDDVDRLDSDEMHAIFRLVRQVADFKNTIYVLSLDEERVSKSIGKYYGSEGECDGRQFLEKIVQIPIVLPQIQKNILRLSLRQVLIDVFSSCGLEGVLEAEELLDKIAPLFETEREIIRYKNQLQFFLPAVYTEVNYSDYCILEAIKTFNHKAYNLIKENKPVMVKDLPTVYEAKEKTADFAKIIEEEYSKLIKQVVELFSLSKQEAVKTIMTYYLSGSSNNKEEHTRTKRLCSPRYFDRYFLQSAPNEIISDRLADTLSCNDVSEIQDWIQNCFMYKDTEVAKALFCMADRKALDSYRLSNLCIAITSSSIADREFFPGIAKDMSMKILPLLLDDDYRHTIDAIFRNASPRASMILLGYMTETEREQIDKESVLLLVGRLKEISFLEAFKYPLFINEPFFRMWKLSDREDFKKYVANAFEDPHFDCNKFVSEYLPKDKDKAKPKLGDLYSLVGLFGVTLKGLINRVPISNMPETYKYFVSNYGALLSQLQDDNDFDILN